MYRRNSILLTNWRESAVSYYVCMLFGKFLVGTKFIVLSVPCRTQTDTQIFTPNPQRVERVEVAVRVSIYKQCIGEPIRCASPKVRQWAR